MAAAGVKLFRGALLAGVLALALAWGIIPAGADPIITPLVVAGLGAVGAGAFAAAPIIGTLTVGGVLGSLVSGVLVTGALYGAEKLLGQSRAQQSSQTKLPAGPVSFETEAQAVGDRFYTYGVDRTGGRYIFRESDGLTLGYGIILGCRPIDAVEAFFVDDELLPLATGPAQQPVSGFGGTTDVTTVDYGPDVQWPTSPSMKFSPIISYKYVPNGKGGGEQVPYVAGIGPCGFLEFRNATDAGISSTLLQAIFPTLWGPDHEARGLTALYSIWKAYAISGGRLAHYPRGYPIHSTVIRGARVFDPRDGTQSFLEGGVYTVYNSTWKYSANPALQIADYLTFPEAFGLAYADIDWDSIADAADACDALVLSYGGIYEHFAQCHLTWGASEGRLDVINRMLATCDGLIYEAPDGRVTLRIAAWEVPTLTLTGADISSIETDPSDGVYAETNYVTATYVEPRTNFSKNTSIVFTDDASIAAVGDRRSTLDFSCVHSFSQAYRLTARTLRRRNTPEKLTITGGPRLLLADGERVLAIEAPEFGISGIYRIMGMTAQTLASVTLKLHRVTEDMFANAVPPYDPVNNALPGVPVIGGIAPGAPTIATTIPAITGTGGTGTPRNATITASVTPPLGDTSSDTRFQSRAVDVSTHAPLGSGDWTIWTDFVSQYAVTSPIFPGVHGTDQAFEIVSWMVSTQGIPGDVSASAFVPVAF